MDKSLWMVMLLIAAGTFAMRVLPMLWMSRRMKDRDQSSSLNNIPTWLSVLGPTMIAAMFGTSLIPTTPSLSSWLATLVGTLFTLLIWYWKRSLGLPVLAGVAIYGAIIYVGGLM
ncbi:branched-chain amino acid ABC transporter [Vibrio breoganii]|uniref:AzlD domain-containing protein n=1 Tax=Vibrio breoganii TaxID=553239 RepID=A0ABX1U691_9VIBR|nr:AzlD domain-containing protein [Vibrio breoganii]NMO72897.1 AzlD domain-containing protein [Vibrio breoganii]NMR68734.1 AzlD domain-containing protein [Vibrio breoganii]PMG03938.1 branched-chain amino acid ABC transporter [Vibrio breoganii]PMG39306.1 branched-chain amino acid ABC transporter [Vibrio breoganii]PML33759.1 branched-chain amino acid ABC transporter [Vibrio breoganii]